MAALQATVFVRRKAIKIKLRKTSGKKRKQKIIIRKAPNQEKLKNQNY